MEGLAIEALNQLKLNLTSISTVKGALLSFVDFN